MMLCTLLVVFVVGPVLFPVVCELRSEFSRGWEKLDVANILYQEIKPLARGMK